MHFIDSDIMGVDNSNDMLNNANNLILLLDLNIVIFKKDCQIPLLIQFLLMLHCNG